MPVTSLTVYDKTWLSSSLSYQLLICQAAKRPLEQAELPLFFICVSRHPRPMKDKIRAEHVISQTCSHAVETRGVALVFPVLSPKAKDARQTTLVFVTSTERFIYIYLCLWIGQLFSFKVWSCPLSPIKDCKKGTLFSSSQKKQRKFSDVNCDIHTV